MHTHVNDNNKTLPHQVAHASVHNITPNLCCVAPFFIKNLSPALARYKQYVRRPSTRSSTEFCTAFTRNQHSAWNTHNGIGERTREFWLLEISHRSKISTHWAHGTHNIHTCIHYGREEKKASGTLMNLTPTKRHRYGSRCCCCWWLWWWWVIVQLKMPFSKHTETKCI